MYTKKSSEIVYIIDQIWASRHTLHPRTNPCDPVHKVFYLEREWSIIQEFFVFEVFRQRNLLGYCFSHYVQKKLTNYRSFVSIAIFVVRVQHHIFWTPLYSKPEVGASVSETSEKINKLNSKCEL